MIITVIQIENQQHSVIVNGGDPIPFEHDPVRGHALCLKAAGRAINKAAYVASMPARRAAIRASRGKV